MAKFFGPIVKVGRIGGSVFRVRGGVTIESQYQPNVFNPKTAGQVSARARLKAMAQLSEIFSPTIAMPRVALVSPRNKFVSANYGLASYSEGEVSVDLMAIQLTTSVLGLGNLTASRTGSEVTVALSAPTGGLSHVVYAAFVKTTGNRLRYQTSMVVDVSAGTTFQAVMQVGALAPVIVYAYGIRDNTEAARIKFGDISVLTAETVARLIVSRELTESDVTLTETRAIEVEAGS